MREREPDWTRLPPDTPSAIRHVLARCLEKDPKRRLRDMADVRFELEDFIAPALSRSLVLRSWTFALVLALIVVAAGLYVWRSRSLPTDGPNALAQDEINARQRLYDVRAKDVERATDGTVTSQPAPSDASHPEPHS